MTENSSRPDRVLYSVGHSNHQLEVFFSLLRKHGIEVLVDVRSQPYSQYAVHFVRPALETALRAAKFKYLFLGKELGGRPEGAEFYDSDGRVLYSRVAESDDFLRGIARLEKGIEKFRVAVMCTEENPAKCHRRLLVGRVLRHRGTKVVHIRGDGTLESEEQLELPFRGGEG